MSTASLTRAESADTVSSEPVSASWQMNRRRDRACRADPAWIVVKPWTPDDRVKQQRQGLPVPHLADDGDVGCHAEEARDQAAQVDLLRSARAGRVCM